MVHFVVPGFNEAANVPALLAELVPRARRLGARIIFVDDGSTDGTADLVRAHATGVRLEIVRHSANEGVGVALNTGIRHALDGAGNEDAIVTLEGDNTSDIGDLDVMLDRFEEGFDIVLASVYARGGRIIGVSKMRLIASRAVSDTFRWLGGLRHIRTLSSLYRVYRAGTLRRAAATYGYLLVREPGFAASVELLLKLHNAGATVAEVPTTNDWSRRRGPSKLRLWPTVRAYFRVMTAHIVGRIQPPPISPMSEREVVVWDTTATGTWVETAEP